MNVPITRDDLAEFLDFHWPQAGGRAEIVRKLADALVDNDVVAEPVPTEETGT